MNPSDAIEELNQAAAALAELPGDMIDAAVPAAKTAILDSVTVARGGLSMSGLNAELDVADTIEESETSASARLTATPPGPWAMVESGTKKHEQNRRGSKTVGSRAMPTPYGYYSKVVHPGTAGLGVWGPATAAADVAVDRAVRAVVDGLPSN